jgi:RimJ/RimL family protein N-acetyltransferase
MTGRFLDRDGARLSDGVVTLRPVDAGDVTAILRHAQHPELQRAHWLPVFGPLTQEGVRKLIREFREGWSGPFGLTFVISDPALARFDGIITLRAAGEDSVEVSYGVAPDMRGRGLATRALKLVSAWALHELGVKRLRVQTARLNLASQRVAEKAGFVRVGYVTTVVEATGEAHEDVLYSLER